MASFCTASYIKDISRYLMRKEHLTKANVRVQLSLISDVGFRPLTCVYLGEKDKVLKGVLCCVH